MWWLILTCNCGMPTTSFYPTKRACFEAAQSELFMRNMNTPSYKCIYITEGYTRG